MTRPCDDSRLRPTLRRGSLDVYAAAAYDAFLREVFGFAPPRPAVTDPRWEPWAYFDGSGRCVAGLEVGLLDLVVNRVDVAFAGLRLVGVLGSHRGRGLFRDLVTRALAWCDARGPTLLYTEVDALYTPFGFAALAQHAFVGPAPAPPAGVRPAKAVDAACARMLIDRLAPNRTPVSWQCAMRSATDLLRANLDGGDLAFAYAENLDALLIYESDVDELVLVDVVAAEMPSMVEIVAALQVDVRRLRVLFPPDRLDWRGTPEPDETGLMIRGVVPAGMSRPFMLPPTTGF